MKAIIVEDEPMVREDLRYLLKAHPGLRVIGEAGTVPEARKLFASLHADVVFLDIQLIGGSGFDLVPLVPSGTRIIFFTSYDAYAVRAFEVNALDYLLKPVSAERLAASLQRLSASKEPGTPPSGPAGGFREEDRIFLHTDKERRFVPVREIAAVLSAGGNYSFFHMHDGRRLMVRKSLKECEHLLPEDLFMRIHRSAIISLHHVSAVRKSESGPYQVLVPGVEIPLTVSRRSARRFKTAMAQWSVL